MMTLADVAKVYDTEVFTHTNGSTTFKGQMLVFTDSTRSGPSSKRRILEVGPAVTFPADKLVTDNASGQVFLLSSVSYDWFNGAVIAKKTPVLPVDHTYSYRTIEQVLSNAAGSSTYMEPSYIRRVILEEKSDYMGGYEIRFSSQISLVSGTILYGDSRWYRCRENSRIDDIGFGTIEAVELDNPVATQTVTTRVLNPITDVMTNTTVSIKTFTEPLVLDYRHEVLGFLKPEAGDLAVSVLKSAVTLNRGDLISTHGLVMAVESAGNTWCAHVRRNQ